jgi:hypothetical protein
MDLRAGFPLLQIFSLIVVSDLLVMIYQLVSLSEDTSVCCLLAVYLLKEATYLSALHPVDVVDLLKL